MKVFISHSSREKWIARKISQDLVTMGCVTFLDEKDITTGKAIDESIGEHLSDCDDFLILLSQESLKSAWVLVELGGAIALKKKIIPILLFIDANAIPDVISRFLARDINEIEKYYEEVKKLLENNTTVKTKNLPFKQKPIPKRRKGHEFKVGQTVKIHITAPIKIPGIGWNDKMDAYLGATGKITQIDPKAESKIIESTVKLDVDNEDFFWHTDWLTPVTKG